MGNVSVMDIVILVMLNFVPSGINVIEDDLILTGLIIRSIVLRV